MSSSRKRRKSKSKSFDVKKKRSALRTVLETLMGVSIGAVILFGIIWYYFIREEPAAVKNSEVAAGVVEDNVVTRLDSYKVIRDEGSLNDQLFLLSQLKKWPQDVETPIKLDTLGKRFELAQTILKNSELDEEGRVAAARASINAVNEIYFISLDEGIATEGQIKDDFNRVISTFLNDPDALVAREAKISEIKLLVFDNVNKDLAGSYDTIQREILNLISQSPSDPVVLSTITKLAGRVKYEDQILGDRLFSAVLNAYRSQPKLDEKLLPRLKIIEDKIAISESEIGVLTPEIARSEKFEVYFNKLAPLIDKPDTGVNFVSKLNDVVGYLEAVDETEKAIRVLKRIEDSVAKKTDREAMIHASRMARFGLIRNSAVGKPIQFDDTGSDGLPLDVSALTNRPVILAFYSPNSPRTENVFGKLSQTCSLLANTGVKVIAIAVEPPAAGRNDSNLNPEWLEIVSIPPKSPQDSDDKVSEIFKRLPVSQVPYFALVDAKGVVRHIRVPLDQLKTKVEAMVSATAK